MLVDSSVAVPALVEGHAWHERALALVAAERPALAGHALFETFAVVTGLPGRGHPEAVLTAIDRMFPNWLPLTSDGGRRALDRTAEVGLIGGAVYDALVGAAAAEADVELVTADKRARRTYASVGARARFVDLDRPSDVQ